MTNRVDNKNYINHLKLVGLFATILFMFLLTYLLMWNPYTLYFDRPEFSSTPYERRESFAELAALFNFLILLGLTVFSVVRFWKKKKFVLLTPVVGVVTLIFLLQMNKYYPDSNSEYTKYGYRFLEQRWHHKGDNNFKRFKSEKRFEQYSDNKQIIWQLDSVSK